MSIPLKKMDELLVAIKALNVEDVQALVKEGVNLEEILDKARNFTPLLLAGTTEIPLSADEEIEAALNSPETNEKVILRQRMICERREAIIKILLDAGANIDHQDSNGYTILNHSIAKDQENSTLCPMLIERGANIHLYKPEEMFPPLMHAIILGHCDLALLLIERDADVNYKGSDYRGDGQRTALMEIFDYLNIGVNPRYSQVLEALLNAKADPNATDSLGRNILFNALNTSLEVRDRVIPLLLNQGASVQQRDKKGDTPIWQAFKFDKNSSIKMMIEKADPSLPCNEKNETIFEVAARMGYVKHLQSIYNLGVDQKILQETFAKIGQVSHVDRYTARVFGHPRDEYELDQKEKDDIVQTVKWFLKYIDSNFLKIELKRRKEVIKADDALLENADLQHAHLFPYMQSCLIERYIQRLIVDVIMQELIKRKEIELHQNNTQEALLFAHPAHPKRLREFAEIVSTRMGASADEVMLDMVNKKNKKQRLGLLPYWVLANRSKADRGGFPFCQLDTTTKAYIISFLEPQPYCVAVLPGYDSVLRKRLTWAQNAVNVPYEVRKHREDEAKKQEQQKAKQLI